MVINKAGRPVDYAVFLQNIDDMINTLEYDSQRSAGKVKINASTLNDLYALRPQIVAKLPKNTPTKKEG